jgi:hypothetical protein
LVKNSRRRSRAEKQVKVKVKVEVESVKVRLRPRFKCNLAARRFDEPAPDSDCARD